MATKLLMFAALACGLAALATARSDYCKPTYNPKLDCSKDEAPGWRAALTMMYKYYPQKLSFTDANAACKPIAREMCSSSRYQSYLVSYLTENEWEDAIIPAYEDACYKNGNLFWTGAYKIKSSKLYYKDSINSKSRKHAFPGSCLSSLENGHCIAVKMNGRRATMVSVSCNKKLPYMCKIMPTRH